MNNWQRKVLVRLFAKPVSATVAWADIEAILTGVGCVATEGSGSRVSFAYNGHIESFHRPHRQEEAKRYQVRQARDFLKRIGFEP